MKTRGFEKVTEIRFVKDTKLTKIEYDDLMCPRRGTKYSAGYDFYAPTDFKIESGEIKKIPTGIKVYMLEDEYLAILDRSSAGFKYNIRLCNQVGIIDSDYYGNKKNEGHIFIALQNEGTETWEVKKGEAFAQGIFMKYLVTDDDEPINEKRVGGIGSTNKKGE